MAKRNELSNCEKRWSDLKCILLTERKVLYNYTLRIIPHDSDSMAFWMK